MHKPDVVDEPPERDLRRTLTVSASRLVTAIGITAIVAFLYLAMVVPKSQKTDAAELASSKKSDSLKSSVFDPPTLAPIEPAQLPPEESQALLERLKEWQHTR